VAGSTPRPECPVPQRVERIRRSRNDLLEREAELRELNEQVAAQRRALPPGGLIKEDYVFESAADDPEVRLSELFAPGNNSLVIYNMMFPRWSEDARAGAPGGKTAELPLVEQPCPSCTSVVDGLEGCAFHVAERINLVVIARTSPDRLRTYAQEPGWRHLRLLSSRSNTFNRDYHAETPDGMQRAVLHVFSRDEDGIHHHWTTEMAFKHGETGALDPVWPIYGVLDSTPEGRGDRAAYPNLQYWLFFLWRGDRIFGGFFIPCKSRSLLGWLPYYLHSQGMDQFRYHSGYGRRPARCCGKHAAARAR
jgi:predicted dithiol-disulfide oxidoreductase (DUF899 family)